MINDDNHDNDDGENHDNLGNPSVTRPDCDDGSDEMVCTRTCLAEEFTCKNGLCIQVIKNVTSLSRG